MNKYGKEVAVIDGYTFYLNVENKTTQRWPCNKKYCKAALTMTKSREIIRANLNHNHSPPKFIVRNGIYIKI